MKLRDKVVKALTECGVKNGSRILVGTSGGPDSTTLLYILHHLKKEFDFTLFAAYLDHGMRKKTEIEKDIKFLHQVAASLQIELFIGRIPVGELNRIALNETRSMEEVARKKRYQFLGAVCKKVKANYIALGHVEDDHLETIVMRFFQGGGVTGLAGIPLYRDGIIRPLFYCTKEEIYTYLNDNEIGFVVDSSNRSKAFLRNKIRLNLIPVVRNIFPGYQKGLKRLSGLFRLLNSYFEEEIRKTCNWEKTSAGKSEFSDGYRMNKEKFLQVHGVIRLFSLYKVLNNLYDDEKIGKKERIPYKFLSPVLDKENITGRRVILRGYGIALICRGKYLFCRADIVYPRKKSYLIHGEKGKRINIQAIGCIIHIYNGKKQSESKNTDVTLIENCIHYPLVIRSRMPGDKIKSGKENKSLKKLFNEWKVPENRRWVIPVLADRKQIVAVAGKEFGFENRFAPDVHDRESGDTDIVTIELRKKI
ncbi:MAG: tRNA lysidine(34) synthetase TilS [Spirochaetales bacterium]|nr:tRNA lysidine(34) synthetase TilS [Spirochaetales bacterium]